MIVGTTLTLFVVPTVYTLLVRHAPRLARLQQPAPVLADALTSDCPRAHAPLDFEGNDHGRESLRTAQR